MTPQETDCYGDGNVYRGIRSKDSFNPNWNTEAVLVEEMQRMAKRIEELEALAQPEQEPVAWEQFYPDIGKPQIAINSETVGYVAPQRTWVDLTRAQFAEILCDDRWQGRPELMMLQVQAKLKEKNT